MSINNKKSIKGIFEKLSGDLYSVWSEEDRNEEEWKQSKLKS